MTADYADGGIKTESKPATPPASAGSSHLNQDRIKAQRYIEVALVEIDSGNYAQAITLLERAQHLWPESQAEEILMLTRKLRLNANARKKAYAHETKPTCCQRDRPPSAADEEGVNVGTDTNYTALQLEVVKKVNRCKNFYQVLSVTHSATEAEIRKAYKRLALQLHPDKNRAPGSVEAFKTVANAVHVLTNEDKRKAYDVAGANTLSTNDSGSNNAQRYYHNAYTSFENAFGGSDDISAEELFNMFFGNFPRQTRRRRTYQSANQRQPTEIYHQPSLAFGLILVLILISVMSTMFTVDPSYNLVQTRKYPIRRETKHLAVPYYVGENFERDYSGGSLGRLENTVEEDYIYTMKQNCYREYTYREAMKTRARSFGSRTQYAQAEGLKTPSCDNLSDIGVKRYNFF